jgi:peroxiredoxin
MFRVFVAVAASLIASVAFAGEFNGVLNIGDAAPAWSDLPGTDGQQHSLAELPNKKVVVVVFTCNSCPVARDYEDRIIDLARRRSDDVAVVAINVNRGAEDSLPKMEERAKAKQFPYAYLFDETQKIGRDYGASATPHFFVLSADRKIVYMGALDDASDPADVKINFVDKAIDAALAGMAPSTTETFARGCGIRYARQRGK